jgi:hypothetical protein
MYCVQCGAGGAARFCRECGKSQSLDIQDGSTVFVEPNTAVSKASLTDDWAQGLDYHRLLEFDEPRKRLVAASKRSKSGVTGDDVLAIFEAVSPSKISWSKLTHAIVPFVDKLGIRTSNRTQADWQAPAGRVLLAYLCTLASHSLEVTEVQQEEDSCILSAKIPLGIITNSGKVTTKLETQSGWVRATMVVTISGQFYDWGRSKRLLEDFLAGINADLMEQDASGKAKLRRVA